MSHHKKFALGLALLLGLGLGQIAMAGDPTQEGGMLLATTEPGNMSNPQERFLAIAPIFGLSNSSPEEYSATRLLSDRNLFSSRSRELGVSERRLELWHDLFLNNGRPGLSSLQDVNLHDWALDSAGTWVLMSRHLEGHYVDSKSVYLWELVSLNLEQATFRTLLVEEGVLETFLTVGPADGSTYYLGQYTTVTVDRIATGQRDRYAEKNGFEARETALRSVQEGELFGLNYPGVDRTTLKLNIDTLSVKQGDMYNQVRMEVLVNGKDRSTYQGGQFVPMPANSLMIMHAAHFDGQELYERIDGDVPVRRLDRLWELMKQNPEKYLKPSMFTDEASLAEARRLTHDHE